MTKTKSYFILLIILTFLGGCVDSDKKESSAKIKKAEMKYPMKSIMVNKNQCQLYGEFKDLKVEDIVGVWYDTLFWKMQPNDSCYYGIDELDVSVELEIKPTKTFRLSTKYSRPEHDTVELGEYFLNYDSVKTTLVLASNPKGEVLFEQGDTMRHSVIYDLKWIDSNTMILDSKVEKGGHILREGIELKKRPANKVYSQ